MSATTTRIPPNVHQVYKGRARQLRTFQNSVSHLYGIAVERSLSTRGLGSWHEFFASGEDTIDRVVGTLTPDRALPPLPQVEPATDYVPLAFQHVDVRSDPRPRELREDPAARARFVAQQERAYADRHSRGHVLRALLG